MAAINEWAWVIWLVLIALFLVIEMFTLEFTFLMLALGSVAGLISSTFLDQFWAQAIVAAIVAVALLLAVRPPLLRRFRRGGSNARFGTEALLGLHGVVQQTVTPVSGQVKLDNGDIWTARARPQEGDLPVGSPITVQTIEGAIARVAPIQANQKESA